MIIKGKIENKELKKTKANVQYATFTIEGKNFNSFDAVIINDFNKGDFVEIETKTDKTGKFENMISMKKIVESEAPKQESKPMPTLKPIPQEFHQSIEAVRYEALDIALKFLTLRGEKPTMDLVLNMANVYLEFIQGKIDGMYDKSGLKGVRPEENKNE